MEEIKVFLPQRNRQNIIGGGWTFNRNIQEGLLGKVFFTDNINECDIVLISGPTMLQKDEGELAKSLGKKIILRVDNVPLPSRNRGGGFSHLIKFAKLADKIVYQSNWAMEYISYWLDDNKDSNDDKNMIIYNGVDTDIFKKEGPRIPTNGKTIYLFDAHSSNETKRFYEARYWYQWELRVNEDSEFWIVGESKNVMELKQYNFDFVDPKAVVRCLGTIEDPWEMARIYRTADYLIFPSFADACPNSVLEAMACGCEIINTNPEGGTNELLEPHFDYSLERMADEYFELFNELIKK